MDLKKNQGFHFPFVLLKNFVLIFVVSRRGAGRKVDDKVQQIREAWTLV